jgi:hypothetical protein
VVGKYRNRSHKKTNDHGGNDLQQPVFHGTPQKVSISCEILPLDYRNSMLQATLEGSSNPRRNVLLVELFRRLVSTHTNAARRYLSLSSWGSGLVASMRICLSNSALGASSFFPAGNMLKANR